MSDDHTTSNLMPDRLTQALAELGARWGWFVALGIVLLVLSIMPLGHILAATLVSVIFIAVLMLIGGIGQLIHAWRVKQLAGFLFWPDSGLLYAAAGIIALV